MNCEHIEERLSAYLDNMLIPEERREIAIHLQGCSRCMMSLAELRQNDILLAQLPRMSPSPMLRERLFSLPEMRELTGTNQSHFSLADEWTRPLGPARVDKRDSHPYLVSLPGGRNAQSQHKEIPPTPPTTRLRPSSTHLSPQKRKPFVPLQMAVAALLLVVLGSAALFVLAKRHQAPGNVVNGAITPPAAGPGAGPLAAGTRFVFLRDGALWSTLVGGNKQKPERLTPTNVTVATNWTVSPALPGHTAGDMLAYIDLQSAAVHTIRSDGQQDTTIQQPLLKAGTVPATIWETTTGETMLSSMVWSKDGSLLAFVGDPAGTGTTNLYLYGTETGKVQAALPGLKGSVAHPVWSADSKRLALTLAHDGIVSVLDYNVQSQGVLDLSNLAAAQGNSLNGILSLDWSPSASAPAVTWSLGTIGHVSSLWIHRVGTSGTIYPQQLLSGNYVQALYSQSGDNGAGSWLVVSTLSGLAGDLWRIDLAPGATLVQLSRGKQVSLVRWAPDGSAAFYMDQQSNGLGSGSIVNVSTGANQLLASNVAANPIPVWSANSSQLAYSTGTRINIVNAQNGSQVLQLPLQGTATSLSWSPGTAQQLVVSLLDSARGIYLVDTAHNTTLRLDQLGTNSTIQWSEIP